MAYVPPSNAHSHAEDLLPRYAEAIMKLTPHELSCHVLPSPLLMGHDGPLSVYYAPLDYVNTSARVVIVGITPGRQQMANALRAAHTHLIDGTSAQAIAKAVKAVASFSGPMRANLVEMLDHFSVARLLGINSCSSLFGADSHLAHFTSALKFPVFKNDANYNGSPSMIRNAFLRGQLSHFANEAASLPNAVFVPLGEKARAAVEFMHQEGLVSADRVLAGIEHPSGANNERIQYLVGKKPRHLLSPQTPPARLDEARDRLRRRAATLLQGDSSAAGTAS